jgi:hypothetical protein
MRGGGRDLDGHRRTRRLRCQSRWHLRKSRCHSGRYSADRSAIISVDDSFEEEQVPRIHRVRSQ